MLVFQIKVGTDVQKDMTATGKECAGILLDNFKVLSKNDRSGFMNMKKNEAKPEAVQKDLTIMFTKIEALRPLAVGAKTSNWEKWTEGADNAVKEFLGKYKIKEKDGSKADQLGTLYAAAYFSFKPDWHNEKGKYDASNAKDGLGNMTKEVYEMGGLFANALSSMYGQKFTQTVRDASVLLAIHVAQANHRVKQLYQKVKEPGRKAGDVDGTDVSRLNALGVNDFMNVVGTRESKIPTPSQIYPLLMLLYPSDFTYTGQMARNEENRKALENYFKK